MGNTVIYWKHMGKYGDFLETYGKYGDLWEIHSGKHTNN